MSYKQYEIWEPKQMEPPKSPLSSPFTTSVAIVAIILASFALFSPTDESQSAGPNDFDDSLTSVREERTLRVGYGGFPPYTQIDPTQSDPNKRVTGFSVDLINEIASRAEPPLKVEWVPFTWDTLRAEVDADKFDVIADPVFQTIPRAEGFRLIRPYSYFGIGAAIVRSDENRFTRFEDLNDASLTIALAEGWTTSELARKRLDKPAFRSIPVSGDALAQLEEVRLGRADVALNDVPTVLQYARAYPDEVKALWAENPPSIVPGGFLVAEDSDELADFLDEAIEILIADGTIVEIDSKWKSFGFIPQPETIPGQGIQR